MLEINNISKIGVISDTHISKWTGPMPPVINDYFKDAGLIIHCGDIVSQDVIKELETLAPVIAVKGNMDNQGLGLPVTEVILVNGIHKICVSHGSGSHNDIMHRLYKEFIHYKPSIILYGHTHKAGESEYNGIRFFNPGSPTASSECCSIGVININGAELKTNVIVI
jgi:putative phosphoesterase